MKVSELSRRSQVPLPTIKFYIREGLLPPGERTGRNQADYGPRHLERLTLIRSLRDDAGLPIEAIARSLRAADAAREDFIVAGIDALERPTGSDVDRASAQYKRAERVVLGAARRLGWKVRNTDRSVGDAARALAVIGRAFPHDVDDDLRPYVDVAQTLAEHEIPDSWAPEASPDAALRYAVLGTILFEPLILALRRMAHVARSRKLDAVRAPETKRRAKR